YITSFDGLSSAAATQEIAECARLLVDSGVERVTLNMVNAKGGSVSTASAVLEALFAPNAFPLVVAGTSLAARNYVCDPTVNPYTETEVCEAANAFYDTDATNMTVGGITLNYLDDLGSWNPHLPKPLPPPKWGGNTLTDLDPVSCMSDSDCLDYAQSLSDVSDVVRAVIVPSIGLKSNSSSESASPLLGWSDSSLGVLAGYRPDQITVVTSATCRDACSHLAKGVATQRLGVIVTMGMEDTTVAASPSTVLEDTGCYKSPTLGQFHVPLATAEASNGVWDPSSLLMTRSELTAPNVVYSRGWTDGTSTAADLADISAYLAGDDTSDNGWFMYGDSGVARLKPKDYRVSDLTYNEGLETQTAEGEQVTMVSGVFVDDSDNGDTATYTLWSCAEGNGLRLMGPRITAE
ncbi:hypothetical protein KIPB_009088, partial [Kipferlia bialata]